MLHAKLLHLLRLLALGHAVKTMRYYTFMGALALFLNAGRHIYKYFVNKINYSTLMSFVIFGAYYSRAELYIRDKIKR